MNRLRSSIRVHKKCKLINRWAIRLYVGLLGWFYFLLQWRFLDENILFLMGIGSIILNIYLIKYFINCSCSASDLTIPFVNKPDVNPDRFWLHLKQLHSGVFCIQGVTLKERRRWYVLFYKAHYRSAKVKYMALKYVP